MAPASASFGIAFGILASTAGMGSVAPIVMSATTFAGSAQFAAASVLDDGGSIAAAVIAAVLLNARYLAISIAVSPAFEGPDQTLPRIAADRGRILGGRATRRGRIDRRILVAAGLLLYPCWVGATALGVFGSGFSEILSASASTPPFRALFLALLVSVVKTWREIAAALAGERSRSPFAIRASWRAGDRSERRLPHGALRR